MGTSGGNLWREVDARLALMSRRAQLRADVRLRAIGDEIELVQRSTRRVVALDQVDVPIIERLDGRWSLGEMVFALTLAAEHRDLARRSAALIERLVRADLLDDFGVADAGAIGELLEASINAREPHPAVESWAADEPARARPRELSSAVRERARFLRTVRLLDALDDAQIERLAQIAHEETWPAASDIVSEGGRADRFFVIRSGEVNVARSDGDGARQRLGTLASGDWFGDVGLREGARRNATVRAGLSRPVQLYSFDAGAYEQLIVPFLADAPELECIRERRAELGRVPLFRALADEDLDRLATVLVDVEAAAGTVLFRQGEPADRFYVVTHGAVGVVRDGRPIARLAPGEFFGETALLFTHARTATIVATDDARLWALDRSSFMLHVRDALLHRHDMMPTVLGRISSTEPV